MMEYDVEDEILPGILSNDPVMFRLAEQIKKIAPSDKPVLLNGDTGTGKELFANAIHLLSHCLGEIVPVNCSAIPENLFESLLFGHEKGSFTGADKRHHGFFAQANGGTLFFDEVAELPLIHQAKLLRVLESKMFTRIGSDEQIPFTGRIVSATHVDMKQRVKDKLFREDLFYRFNLFELTIPSLDERKDDIALLVNKFAQQEPVIIFSQCALDFFKYSQWPGNIRQLKNTIDRISVLAESDYLSANCIRELAVCESEQDLIGKMARDIIGMPTENKIKDICDALVQQAVVISQGNKTEAARLLGVHRKVVERRLCQIRSY